MWDVGDVGCLGCGMLRIWDVRDVGCSGCGIFGMWDVWDVGYSGCRMFGMWNVWDLGFSGCGIVGMWDVPDVRCGMWDVCRDVGCWFAKCPYKHSYINFFKKAKRGLELVSLPHFLCDFSRKIFLVLCSVKWSNFIAWLLLVLEILGNMCILINYFPICNVINLGINLTLLIGRLFFKTKNSR